MRMYDNMNYNFDKVIEEAESESIRLCDGESMIVHKAIIYENLIPELKSTFEYLDLPFGDSLGYKQRSESRNHLKNFEFEIKKDQIEHIIDKFKFEIEIYKNNNREITPPRPGMIKIGNNIHI